MGIEYSDGILKIKTFLKLESIYLDLFYIFYDYLKAYLEAMIK